MDLLSLIDSQLLVGINALLEATGDKEEAVREQVTSSLKRLAKKYPAEVLCSACAFKQKNIKMSSYQLTSILLVMEHICLESADSLDDRIVKQLVDFSIEEMTKSSEYLPQIQFPPSNIIVSLGQKNSIIVMGGLLPKLQPGIIPHFTILHTMANLAVANVSGFIPFIKAILDTMLPMLPTVRNDPIRQVYSYALGKFSEAILEYLSNVEQRPDPSVTKAAFAEEITAAYDILISSWLQSREAKLVENVIIAVGPMFSIMNESSQTVMTPRTVNCILGLYRRQNSVNHYPLTQCLASVLKAAPTKAIEPLFEQLVNLLGTMVVVTPDYSVPLTVKNHSEVLRCYDWLGIHFPDRLADLLLKQLNSGSERDKVEALIVSAHLLAGKENVLKARIPDITNSLRGLLSLNSARIKKALLKTIVALACRGNAEDGSDFIEFLVRHCCPHPVFTGPEWDDLRTMCSSTVYLLSTTVEDVEPLLWSVLLRLLISPEYEPAVATIARSLAHLASKRNENTIKKNGLGVPTTEAILARCLGLLGSPLNNNRGPHILTFLKHFAVEIDLNLEKLWSHKIPQLITYLEVSEWSDSEWEGLLLEFISSSLQSVGNEDWVIKVAQQLCNQLSAYTPTACDERAALLKTLALADCNLNDKQIVSSHLDIMLIPLRTYSYIDSKACAHAVGILSRVHLNLVLSRLDALSHSELNRRSTRLLGLMKDNRLDYEVECARVTLLRCYASVATHAPPEHFLPRLEDGLMQWLLGQMTTVKEPASREATLLTLGYIADSLDRHKDQFSENLKCKSQLLSVMLTQIENCTVPDPLLLRVTASIVKLPPSIMPEARSTLLRSSFDVVFPTLAGNSTESKSTDVTLILKNIGILVEEILLDDVTPATLDDISTLLEPWLRVQNVQQRAGVVYILKIALQTYYHNMKFAYENPSKFSQSGLLLGRAVLRSLDKDASVHSLALDCVRLILLVTAKYEGLAVSGDPEIDAAFSCMQGTEVANISEGLGKIISMKLPHYQQNHFITSMLEGVSDMEPVCLDSVGEILVYFLQAKGGEMYHHINDILGDVLIRLGALNPSSQGGILKAVLAIAKHHPKVVVSTLLSQPLPLQLSICNCWKTLAGDPAMAADVTEQFIRLMSTTSLLNEEATMKDRPRIAALLPLAVVSALREMFQVASMYDLIISHFSELFTTLLTTLATFIGVSPPVYSPSSTKSMFIPNRDAYKINPAKVTLDAMKNFLLCTKCDSAAESLLEYGLDLRDNMNTFLNVLQYLVKNLCSSVSHLLPKILTCLGQHANSIHESQRVAVAAFHSECIKIQCMGQNMLIDSVLSSLLTSLTDPSPMVRRISLKGLANISYLDDTQREKHCESVLDALVQGLDDHDASSHTEIALEAMTGLSQILPTIQQGYIRDIQVAVALRIKPFFEKENILLRTTSLRLLGELAQCGGPALPGFQDQVKASLVCLLMHLSDPEPSVVKACKSTLRAVSSVLEATKTAAMMNHLIDDAVLLYQEFVTDLAKVMVEEMEDQIPIIIMVALSYSKSMWATIRGNSAIFTGALYNSSPAHIKDSISLDAVTCRLLQLIKDSDKTVRANAAHAISLLFIS